MKCFASLTTGMLRCVAWATGLLLSSGVASAFPETVRHEYVNCSVCHVSPSGGGMLTTYGRGLAKEILATWSRDEEPMAFHGAVQLPDELLIGGGIRTVQTYVDTPKYRQGRYFLMEEQVQVGWSTDLYTVVASVGLNINSPDTTADDKWESPVHYALVNLNKNISVRLGRFDKNYGLNIPNHTAQTKRGLGWDEGSQTYNAEINYASEDYTVAATALAGRLDDKTVDSETGYVFSINRIMNKQSLRFGASYFAARTTDGTNREILGPNFAWGVSRKIYVMGEYDWVRVAPSTGDLIQGYVTYTRAGYELFQGFDLTFTHEAKKNDLEDKKLAFVGYGPGLMWMPRPHFNVYGEWQKQQRPLSNNAIIDSAWFVMQYWL